MITVRPILLLIHYTNKYYWFIVVVYDSIDNIIYKFHAISKTCNLGAGVPLSRFNPFLTVVVSLYSKYTRWSTLVFSFSHTIDTGLSRENKIHPLHSNLGRYRNIKWITIHSAVQQIWRAGGMCCLKSNNNNGLSVDSFSVSSNNYY